MTVKEFLDRFNSVGSRQVSEEVYLLCRDACVGWLLKQGRVKEVNEATGIFVDAVLILLDNAEKDKIKASTTQIKTYLTTVCRNIQSNLNKRKDKPLEIELDQLIANQVADNPSMELEKEALLVRIENTIKTMKTPCITLIKLYYYEGLSHKEIAIAQGYASESVSKSMLYKCKRSFEKLFGDL